MHLNTSLRPLLDRSPRCLALPTAFSATIPGRSLVSRRTPDRIMHGVDFGLALAVNRLASIHGYKFRVAATFSLSPATL